MARILVTGGAGYVGSHCAKALSVEGHECIVFDNLSAGHRAFVRWGRLIEGDIRDAAALDAVFSAQRIDAVIHFAALAYVGESVIAPSRCSATAIDTGKASSRLFNSWAYASEVIFRGWIDQTSRALRPPSTLRSSW